MGWVMVSFIIRVCGWLTWIEQDFVINPACRNGIDFPIWICKVCGVQATWWTESPSVYFHHGCSECQGYREEWPVSSAAREVLRWMSMEVVNLAIGTVHVELKWLPLSEDIEFSSRLLGAWRARHTVSLLCVCVYLCTAHAKLIPRFSQLRSQDSTHIASLSELNYMYWFWFLANMVPKLCTHVMATRYALFRFFEGVFQV